MPLDTPCSAPLAADVQAHHHASGAAPYCRLLRATLRFCPRYILQLPQACMQAGRDISKGRRKTCCFAASTERGRQGSMPLLSSLQRFSNAGAAGAQAASGQLQERQLAGAAPVTWQFLTARGYQQEFRELDGELQAGVAQLTAVVGFFQFAQQVRSRCTNICCNVS
jgi:hypothetical protein